MSCFDLNVLKRWKIFIWLVLFFKSCSRECSLLMTKQKCVSYPFVDLCCNLLKTCLGPMHAAVITTMVAIMHNVNLEELYLKLNSPNDTMGKENLICFICCLLITSSEDMSGNYNGSKPEVTPPWKGSIIRYWCYPWGRFLLSSETYCFPHISPVQPQDEMLCKRCHKSVSGD